jgi:hypothetical protein
MQGSNSSPNRCGTNTGACNIYMAVKMGKPAAHAPAAAGLLTCYSSQSPLTWPLLSHGLLSDNCSSSYGSVAPPRPAPCPEMARKRSMAAYRRGGQRVCSRTWRMSPQEPSRPSAASKCSSAAPPSPAAQRTAASAACASARGATSNLQRIPLPESTVCAFPLRHSQHACAALSSSPVIIEHVLEFFPSNKNTQHAGMHIAQITCKNSMPGVFCASLSARPSAFQLERFSTQANAARNSRHAAVARLCVRLGRERARACVARILAQHGAQHAVCIARAVVLEQQLRLAQPVARDLRRARRARSGALTVARRKLGPPSNAGHSLATCCNAPQPSCMLIT